MGGEVGGGGWRWVEVGGGGWRWVEVGGGGGGGVLPGKQASIKPRGSQFPGESMSNETRAFANLTTMIVGSRADTPAPQVELATCTCFFS